ncbi:MAG: hypothetical protein IKF64_03650, partial [Eubacterium sp.]|nr:hypothetical protein [Eubacterium sp.]
NIKSKNRALLLKLIYDNGVVPANSALINKVFKVKEVDYKNIIFIDNALKKLKDADLIKMIKIYNYKDKCLNNKKDAYVISRDGRISLENCAGKFGFYLYKKETPEYISKDRYDFFCRISTVNFLFSSLLKSKYFTRHEVFSLYEELYGGQVSDEFKSLRFHGAVLTEAGFVPVYYIKNNNIICNNRSEKKFFSIINDDAGFITHTFYRILLADDEKVLKKLILNENRYYNSSSKMIFNKNEKNSNTRTMLFTLKSNNNEIIPLLPCFIKEKEAFNEEVKLICEKEGMNYFYGSEIKHPITAIPLPLPFLETINNFYVASLTDSKNRVIYTYYSVAATLLYVFSNLDNIGIRVLDEKMLSLP